MRAVLRPLPVLYACQGCERFGQAAREFAERLDRAGVAEAHWLGKPGIQPTTRFPVVAVDACADGCALRWLEARGIRPERHYALSAEGSSGEAGKGSLAPEPVQSDLSMTAKGEDSRLGLLKAAAFPFTALLLMVLLLMLRG